MNKIIQNAIFCKECGDYIISNHVHDYKKCSCGKCSVDGGKETLVNVVNDSWNYKLSTAQLQLKEGTIKITATSTDKAGNKSVAG